MVDKLPATSALSISLRLGGRNDPNWCQSIADLFRLNEPISLHIIAEGLRPCLYPASGSSSFLGGIVRLWSVSGRIRDACLAGITVQAKPRCNLQQ